MEVPWPAVIASEADSPDSSSIDSPAPIKKRTSLSWEIWEQQKGQTTFRRLSTSSSRILALSFKTTCVQLVFSYH